MFQRAIHFVSEGLSYVFGGVQIGLRSVGSGAQPAMRYRRPSLPPSTKWPNARHVSALMTARPAENAALISFSSTRCEANLERCTAASIACDYVAIGLYSDDAHT